MYSREKSIRERIQPRMWDSTYLLTSSNIRTFWDLIETLKIEQKVSGLRILDLGCGYKPFNRLFSREGFGYEYVGVDFDRENSEADYILDLNSDLLPFDDEYFDIVILSKVLEHLYNPIHCLKEASRVLKRGGYIYISTPFVFHYHGTPYDFYRYTEFFYRKISEQLGLDILKLRKSGSFFTVPIYVTNIAICTTFQKLKLNFLVKPIIFINNFIAVLLDKLLLNILLRNTDLSSKLQYMNCGLSLILRKCAE